MSSTSTTEITPSTRTSQQQKKNRTAQTEEVSYSRHAANDNDAPAVELAEPANDNPSPANTLTGTD